MRLIGRLKRLEQGVSKQPRVMAAGIAWTQGHEPWAGDLAPGVRLVTDIWITGDCGGTPLWRTVERPARDAEDVGDVYGEDGTRVGRIVEAEGSLVVYREL